MLDSVVEVLTTSHQWSPGSIPGWGKIFSMDCSGYNSGVLREHSSIRFSWVTACGWSETILHDTAFITMWVSFKKWGWPGWLLSAKMEGVGWRGGGVGRDIWVKLALFTYLVKEAGWKSRNCGAGLCWWTLRARWWTRIVFCKERSGCGQLQQKPDSQGALMEVGWATFHG